MPGLNTVPEALTLNHERRNPKPTKLLQYAKICRVDKVIRP
jgi:hypothetical protein